jgi:transposase
VAATAGTLRQLAHDLHPHEPVEQKWRVGSALRPAPAGRSAQRAAKSGVVGQHQRKSASRRDRRAEKNGPQSIGKSRGGWNTKIHLVAANDVHAVGFRLSPGQHGDGPEGRELIGALGCPAEGCTLAMDRAYEGDETRGLACLLGFKPVVPPNPLRRKPWALDKALYRQRNQVERLFRRLKGFRRIFTRYDKLDVLFRAFVTFALIWLALL